MRDTLVGRFVIALTVIVIVSLSLTAYLNHFKFQKSFSGLVQSRFAFVGREIKSAIEESMGVGLALTQLRTTQDIIERMKQQDADIRSVEVFDQQGQVIFSTDRAGIGETIPKAWTRANRQAKPGDTWQWSDADGHAVGLPVVNPLGLVEGGVVLTYSSAVLDARIEAMFVRLARFTGELLALFALLTLLGIVIVLNPSRHRLRQLERALNQTLDVEGRRMIEPGDWQFEHSLAAFEGKARAVMAEISEAHREVDMIDRSAK